MARGTITVQTISRSGLAPTYAAADSVNGQQFYNDESTFLHVKNGGGGSINVTLNTPGTVDGLAVGDLVVAVGAGAEKMIGPFPPGIYNNSGYVYVDYSGATSVTVAAFKL